MSITPEAFKAYGGVPITEYSFTLEVWSLLSGSMPLQQAQVFSKSVKLIWATFAAPVFDIVVPLLPG